MVPSSSYSDPAPTSKALPGAQVTPTLAPATTTAPHIDSSITPLADPKASSMVSAAGPLGPQPGAERPWISSNDPSDPSSEAAKASDPAVLVAPPATNDPSDPKAGGDPSGDIISTSYALSPGIESSAPANVGYIPVAISESENLAASNGDTSILAPGNTIATASNGGIVLGSSTIAVGDQAEIGGHVVSVGSSAFVVDRNTYAVPVSPVPIQNLAWNSNAQSLGGGAFPASTSHLPFTGVSNGDVVIASSTIAVGSQAAINGHVFSVESSAIAVDGHAYALSSQTAETTSPTPTPVLISGNFISAGSNGDIIIGSSTVAVGTQATVYGHLVSAGSSDIVVDGSTYARSFSASITSQPAMPSGGDLAPQPAEVVPESLIGLGRLIMSAFGGPGPADDATSVSGTLTSTENIAGGTSSPTLVGSATSGTSAPMPTITKTSGTDSPTSNGSSARADINMGLWSLIVMFSAVGLFSAVL